MPKVSDILKSGQAVRVDLLLAGPTSNDPTKWVYPTWAGYNSNFVFPVVQWIDDGIVGKLQCRFVIDPDQSLSIVAFGVSFDGMCLMFGGTMPPVVRLPPVVDFQIPFVVQPWESPE